MRTIGALRAAEQEKSHQQEKSPQFHCFDLAGFSPAPAEFSRFVATLIAEHALPRRTFWEF
jgi:hypothetical protein